MKTTLQLALEALENLPALNWIPEKDMQVQEAITAIKEALAQQCVCGEPNSAGTHRTDGPCLAPQPVTWRNAAIRVGEDLCSVGPFGYYDMTAEQWLDWALSVVTVHATPPQRTWVGLTLDERLELAQDVDWAAGAYCEYAEKIEAKLKEKNA